MSQSTHCVAFPVMQMTSRQLCRRLGSCVEEVWSPRGVVLHSMSKTLSVSVLVC